MTDLSTINLKHILAEATPGPDDDDKLALATLSTALAEEVLRLRSQVKGLIVAMETKAANNEPQDPATIARYLKEIVLGDHDE